MRPSQSGFDTEIPCIISYPSFSSSSPRSSPKPQQTYNSYQQQQQRQQYESPSFLCPTSSSNMSSDSCQAMDFDCAVSTLSHITPPPQHQQSSSFARKHSRQQQRRHDSPTPPPPPSTVVMTHHRPLVSPTSSPMPSHPTSHTPKTTSSETVRANVGGRFLSFPMTAFKDLSGLPWKFDSNANVYHLNCSPDVFEVLLDYTLFGTLPAYDTMCQEEFEEFELMALSLRTSIHITPLIAHLDRKSSYWNKELKRQYNRELDASAQTSRPILLNPDTNHTTTSSTNGTKCARFLGALCGVADSFLPSRRRPASVALHDSTANATNIKRLKLTQQGQWTSS